MITILGFCDSSIQLPVPKYLLVTLLLRNNPNPSDVKQLSSYYSPNVVGQGSEMLLLE